MLIRNAILADLDQICEVANKVKIDLKSPQRNGFIVYILSKEEYKYRIQNSKYFYVAEDPKTKKVIGFMMCYDNIALKKLITNNLLNHKQGLITALKNKRSSFILGDQIAILPSYTRKGIGQKFMNKLFKDMKNNNTHTVYLEILHSPLNIASKAFCKKLGFVYQEEIINKYNFKWGIYKLKI